MILLAEWMNSSNEPPSLGKEGGGFHLIIIRLIKTLNLFRTKVQDFAEEN